MRSERVQLPGSGGATVAGLLDLPDGDPVAFALFAHCFTCGEDGEAVSRMARALAGSGIAVFRFDLTGLGGSGGDLASSQFTSTVADLVAAADHLRAHHASPRILIGHSWGGAAVIAAAERVPEARAVVTIGAPAGITDQPQADRIRDLDAALLLMHSPVDEVVGIDNARRIYGRARHPKSFVALDGADHLLTSWNDAQFAASVTAAWASRYVEADEPPEPPATDPFEADAGVVVVTENGVGPYGQRIVAGRHELVADEPVPIGEDSGPTPYDLVLAGLGACTSMTLRMYAERKQWPLEHVTVTLSHSRIHARDCADCETTSGKLDHIDRTVRMVGELDEEQRARLLEIADRCPVHRTLHSEIVVSTREADEPDERPTSGSGSEPQLGGGVPDDDR